MPRLALRNAEVVFEQLGEGSTDLVLVHGFQNDRTGWAPFVDRRDTDRYRVTAYDMVAAARARDPSRGPVARSTSTPPSSPPCAPSSESTHPFSSGTAWAELQPCVRRSPSPFASTPSSWCLPPRQADSGSCPKRRSAHCGDRPSSQQRELALRAHRRPLPPDEFEALMAVVAKATPEHIEGAARSMRGFRCLEDLHRVDTPTLVVCGDRDRHVPLRDHLATQQAIARCGLQLYHDVGHVPFVETPDCFAYDVTRFIEAVVG